jgi:hypothetical protein
MAELARGSVADRPWGRTFATLGLRGVTGQLGLVAEGKRFLVRFDHGAVVAAASPLASDAAVRVALTSHLVSSSQVPEISRRQAAAPGRDEVDLIAELARLGPDHALRLRRRVIAQRAARTFSVSHGEFVVTDHTELTYLEGCELDVRAVVYMGARSNLSEPRLATELVQLGAWFQLKPGLDDDLPQFGFSDVEQPVIERLRDGGTLGEIEDFASSFVDGRTVRSVIYALAACSACDVEPGPGQPRAKVQSRPIAPLPQSRALPRLADSMQPTESTQPMPPAPEWTQPMMPISDEPPAYATTQPLTRSAPGVRAGGPPGASPIGPPRPTPTGERAATMPPIQPARPAVMPLARPTPAGTPPVATTATPPGTPADAIAKPKTTTRIATVPPPPRPPPTSSASPVPRAPSPSPSALATGSASLRPPDAFDGPTWGNDEDAADSSRARQPTAETAGWDSPSGARAPTRESLGRDKSSGSLRLPPEEALADGSPGRSESDETWRRDQSSGPPARSEAGARDASSGSIPLPPHDRLLAKDERRRQSSSPGPGVVVRSMTVSRPSTVRHVAQVDSPQSHAVKALIAQRLKLLDQGADHFQLLGVAPDVAPEPLRKAYFALARQLHPDRLAALGISDDGKHAQRLFAQINAGFAILSDQSRRARYVDILRRGGEAAVRAEQARAEELTRRILEAEEAFRRGELALRRDQPQSAVAEIERAVQLNPDESDYHAALAWARFCAAPDRQAAAAPTRAALDRAIQRAPRSVTPRFYLGRVERMLGRDPEALRHFRDVLTAVPGHAEAASEVRAIEARLGSGDKGPRRR